MRTKFLSIILALFILQPCVCFADMTSSSSMPIENLEEFEIKTERFLEDGSLQNLTSDILHFFTEEYKLSKDKRINVLKDCIFKNTGDQYDTTGVLFAINCGEDSNFKAYVTMETDPDESKITSDFGEMNFILTNDTGKFNIALRADKDSQCEVSAFGVGVNSTAVEGYPLTLTCKNLVSSGTHLNIAKTLFGIALAFCILF